MSRRDEVEAMLREMDDHHSARYYTNEYSKVAVALASEVDERDAVIDKLLAMMEPPKLPTEPCRFSEYCRITDRIALLEPLHARALEIAGRASTKPEVK